MSTIRNAKDTPLNAQQGTIPDVGGALRNWFQYSVFGVVTKTTVNFQVVETVVDTPFRGVVQPMTGRQLMIKPEGERSWNWITVHSDPVLDLKTDSIIIYLGTQFRVMAKKDFEIYGYVYYELVSDWTGSGPTPE